jgi:phage shock protein E
MSFVNVNEIMTCEEIKNLLTIGGQLIDVRSPVEFSQGSLSGAVNMPIESFQYFANSIDKTKPVMLYCRSGARSGAAKQFLETLGFDSVFNIGGYQRYVSCNQAA